MHPVRRTCSLGISSGQTLQRQRQASWLSSLIFLFVAISFISLSKKYEGSNYEDNTSGANTRDNGIDPGQLYKYVWEVPERAGPTPDGTTCIAWAYYSDVNPIKDTNSGLVGPLVVCKKVRESYIH